MFASRHVTRLAPYQFGEQPAPVKGLVKLNTNENPYPPHPSVARVLKNFPTAKLRLYPDPHAKALKAAAAKVLGVAEDHLLFGNGSDEIINLIFRTFFNPEDEAVFTQYTYSAYVAYADALGLGHNILPMGADFRIDLSLLEKLPGKVVFLTNPNAPTGMVVPLAEIELALSTHRHRLFVVDEAYNEFWGQSALPLLAENPNLLILRTFSKAGSLCGIRLGYAVGHPDLIAALAKVKDPYNINMLTQAVGVTVFQNYGHYQKQARKVVATRNRFSKELAALGFAVLPSETNFVMASYSGKSMRGLYEALAGHQIFIRHFDKPVVKDWVRISIGTPVEMKRVVKEIKKWLAPPKGKKA